MNDLVPLAQVNDLEPLAVALKFGFLAVLYLFLLWVTRMALRDLRGTASPGFETGYHEVVPASEPRRRPTPGWWSRRAAA